MEMAGGYLDQEVRSCPPVSLVPPRQTGILPGRDLSMRSFRSGRASFSMILVKAVWSTRPLFRPSVGPLFVLGPEGLLGTVGGIDFFSQDNQAGIRPR
jgi:hypothetical protein